MENQTELERKFARIGDGLRLQDGAVIEGYASLFDAKDQGGDVVQQGAYPAQPIGIWDEVREDGLGLWVKGRLLQDVEKGREAAALIGAGAIDGLSIGYRTVRAKKDDKGQRLLQELELWEVSLVTFPMLPSARVSAKGDDPNADIWREMAAAFEGARQELGRG